MREITPSVRARIALSIATEPNDTLMGEMVNAFGAVQVVEWMSKDPEVTFAREEHREAMRRARARLVGRVVPAVDDVIRTCDQRGIAILIPEDDTWPTPFADLGAGMPFALYVRGDSATLAHSHHVSIVGARAATAYGDHIAGELASDLVRDDIVIVSGGAYGIDGAAHHGAMAAGGRTIAFMAGGVDRFYPAGHNQLLGDVTANGAVVSEVAPGSAPTKWRFLMRNRLIAALGRASIVVEAGFRSGSLNEAGHAHALGRKLGAVPGPITSAASAGTHRLIREMGATLITSADDIRELVGFTRKGQVS